ncbi:MAG TPA: nitroreductase family protein [Candidatus Cloacimonadota bacterium]|nr:nitroreductase family protein [Candidatus Cloacimonadota bacterium]HPT71246.1 nitroreductase family protein [Candidatus Cloacimonadota bacterium]
MTNPVLETIMKRRSCRAYTDESITKEQIDAIVQAGLYAPSAHNNQSWHFTVIRNPDMLNQINVDTKKALGKHSNEFFTKVAENEKFNIFYNAPVAIIVSGDTNSMMPETDCAAASQNMLIAAQSMGLGSCWIGFVYFLFAGEQGSEYKQKLHIPENYKPYYAVIFGHPMNEPNDAPPRKDETVTYI